MRSVSVFSEDQAPVGIVTICCWFVFKTDGVCFLWCSSARSHTGWLSDSVLHTLITCTPELTVSRVTSHQFAHTHTHTDPPYCNKYFKGGKFSKQWCVSVCVFMCVVFAFLRDAGARCHICLLPFSVRFFGFSLCSSSSVLCQQFDLVVGLFELNKHWPGVLCQMKRRRSREAWIPRHSFTHIDMLSYKCMYFCVACIKMCVCVHEWTCMSVCVSVCGCARHFHKGRLI